MPVVGPKFRELAFGTFTLLLGSSAFQAAQAQSFFCPGSVNGENGIALSGGFCTNGNTGAFSNAALAAQALSDVSQAATLQSTQVTLDAVSARRRVEVERTETTEEAAPRTPARRRAPARKAEPVYKAPVYKAPLVVPYPAVTYASWVKAYGDYEKRTGTAQTDTSIAGGIGGIIAASFVLSSTSKTTTGGVQGGFDATWRGVLGPGDGLIAGVLVGYMSADTKLTTVSTSSNPAGMPSGVGTLNAHLTGPTVGGYLTYFRGGFSTDLTFKVDFLDLDLDFTDQLGFSDTGNPGFPTTTVFSGSGSTRLNNYTTAGNLNYRFPAGGVYWVQPTVGFQYTTTDYASGASVFGLADGHVLRVQGGAVFGADYYTDQYRITPSVAALAYDDVSVSGGFIAGGVFSAVPLGLAQEGKIRGQGIFTLNADNGRGFSGFIQGEVRGGNDVIGYAGRAGVRWQWGAS